MLCQRSTLEGLGLEVRELQESEHELATWTLFTLKGLPEEWGCDCFEGILTWESSNAYKPSLSPPFH